MLLFDDDRRVAIRIDGSFKCEGSGFVSMDVLTRNLNGPASFVLAVDRGGDGVAGLFDVGNRLCQLHKLSAHADFQFAENKVSVWCSAGPPSRKRVVC